MLYISALYIYIDLKLNVTVCHWTDVFLSGFKQCPSVCACVPVLQCVMLFLLHTTVNLLTFSVLKVLHGSLQDYGGCSHFFVHRERPQ